MILAPNDILTILKEANSESERNRRSSEFFNREIYEGELYRTVKKEMIRLFPKTGREYTIADYNAHEKITDKKSKAYVKPPIRKLDQEEETKKYNQILDDFHFNDAMKLMDLYKNRHRYCGIGALRNRRVVNGEAIDRYEFWALAPYEFNVHRDENDNIYAWSFPIGKKGDFDVWTIWSDKTHIKVKTKDYNSFEIIPNSGNPKNINPYGIIPFVYVPMDAAGNYKKPSPLPRQTVTLNTNISIYLTAANMQIGQMVIKHPKTQVVESVSRGLMTAMSLPQESGTDKRPTEVEYISPDSDLAGQKEAITTYMMMILDQHGINGTSAIKDGETFSSGFDRLLANADVQDIIEDNQDIYTRAENGIYKIIQAMNKHDYIFKSKKLKVKFAKPKILTSDSERLENLKKKKELGLWEPWELVQESDPNLTEEEAKEKAIRLGLSLVEKPENNSENDGNQKGRNIQRDQAEASSLAE